MIYEIKNNDIKASFDSKGAELISLKDSEKTEYMWQKDEKYWDGTSPILFPIVGRVEDNSYSLNGEHYNMQIHGFLRDEEFVPVFESQEKITFSFFSDETTKSMFPFDFEFKVTYSLEGKSLSVNFEVINKGNEKMPFSIGAHPGFNIPLYKDEKFEDYEIVFEKEENASCPIVDENYKIDFSKEIKILDNEKVIKLNHELFKDDALIFENLKSVYLVLKNKNTGKGIKFEFGKFPYLLIWQAYSNDTPFLCIEPWHGMGMCSDDSDFLKKRGMIILESHKEFKIGYNITLI